jgi:hypothetical protein
MPALVVVTCRCGARYMEDMERPYGCCPGCSAIATWCADGLRRTEKREGERAERR